jgi:hypothetical protein
MLINKWTFDNISIGNKDVIKSLLNINNDSLNSEFLLKIQCNTDISNFKFKINKLIIEINYT